MNTVQLSEDVGMYVDKLRTEFDAVDEVWLIGARANDPAERNADWELLIFADQATLDTLRSEPQWHRSDLSLIVVVDGQHFGTAWGEPTSGSLSDLDWRLEDAQTANYQTASQGVPPSNLIAQRVR